MSDATTSKLVKIERTEKSHELRSRIKISYPVSCSTANWSIHHCSPLSMTLETIDSAFEPNFTANAVAVVISSWERDRDACFISFATESRSFEASPVVAERTFIKQYCARVRMSVGISIFAIVCTIFAMNGSHVLLGTEATAVVSWEEESKNALRIGTRCRGSCCEDRPDLSHSITARREEGCWYTKHDMILAVESEKVS